jgi:hypothetical protein
MERECDRVAAVGEQIAKMPAEGVRGVAVKLAMRRYYNGSDKSLESEDMAIASAHATLTKLTGVDLLAPVEIW